MNISSKRQMIATVARFFHTDMSHDIYLLAFLLHVTILDATDFSTVLFICLLSGINNVTEHVKLDNMTCFCGYAYFN